MPAPNYRLSMDIGDIHVLHHRLREIEEQAHATNNEPLSPLFHTEDSNRNSNSTANERTETLSQSSDSTYVSESEILEYAANSQENSLPNDEEDCKIESPAKKIRLSVPENDSETCPICLDNWTTSGEHRLCCLKCGHLFGYSCLKRWLSSELRKTCPTCKKKVNLNEIRYIYARKIIAADTTELTTMKDKLDSVIQEKNVLQIELSKAVCRIHSLSQEVEQHKQRLFTLMNPQTHETSTTACKDTVSLYKEKTLDLGKHSDCRVFDCKISLDKIAVSVKSTNYLYTGFGIKTISASNYKPMSFIPLHTQAIRDIKFHESEPWLLTCSVDKKAKILDINSNNIAMTLESSSPLWSCCWGKGYSHTLYIGEQQGATSQYDIRQPSEAVCTLSVPGDFSPVVSVQAIKPSYSLLPLGGVVSCKLNSIWLYEATAQEHLSYPLPLEGPFTSMSYQEDSDHLFLSSRSNSRYPYTRHFFCGFSKEINVGVKCNIIHTLRGGNTQKMLSRSCLISNPNNYAAAYIEDQRIVCLWNINTGARAGSIPAKDSVLDLNNIKTANADFLLSLTQSKLEFFKFVS